eukprot:64168-Pyramimonas_sp.AAC.1
MKTRGLLSGPPAERTRNVISEAVLVAVPRVLHTSRHGNMSNPILIKARFCDMQFLYWTARGLKGQICANLRSWG